MDRPVERPAKPTTAQSDIADKFSRKFRGYALARDGIRTYNLTNETDSHFLRFAIIVIRHRNFRLLSLGWGVLMAIGDRAKGFGL